MNPMKRKILVRIDDYRIYLEKYNTNKLDSSNEIYTNGGFPLFLKIEEEIFDGTKTDYDIIESESDRFLIKFKSNSGTEYRFDIFKEPYNNIWHLAFSLFDNKLDNEYHEKTNKRESIFSKLIWILKDINVKIRADEYCIGATGDSNKDSIYEYMMRYVSGWEKRKTDQYKLGWALYFKI